jgi:HEAT repeat protein
MFRMGVSGTRLRVFLSSPGDVVEERAAATRIVEDLQYDPLLRGRVSFELVSWDRTGTTMLASRTPQESVDAGLPLPSECDIVVVVMWKRIGTPLPSPPYVRPDGRAYESGTVWEFEEALRGGTASVLLYRSRMPAEVRLGADDLDEQRSQFQAVEDFFAGLRDGPTGAVRVGYATYRSLEEFRAMLARDLRDLTRRRLDDAPAEPVAAAPLWDGSPFPGLRPFTPADAPIYFGRGRETDELVSLVRGSRFVAVVGASGSGKSSLVGAGLLPRLAGLPEPPVLPSYDEGTGQWVGLRFTPGELGPDPFLALAVKLAPLVRRQPRELAAELAASPAQVGASLARIGPDVLVVVDQFEELFTAVDAVHSGPFVALLGALAEPPGRVVLTLRADFYHRCVEIPDLARLLERGQLPLSTPDDTLVEMIGRPADRAGLEFEEGLPGRIAHDAGREPGALPLLAYALDELYRRRAGTRLTHAAYADLGGVTGAIGRRADAVFDALDADTRAAFDLVFRELVSVDRNGQLARRRAPLAAVTGDAAAARLVRVLTDARLLVTDVSHRGAPTAYVAHEALFGSWRRLREWADIRRDDLRVLDQVRAAAADWDRHDRSAAYLWPHERLSVAEQVVARLRPDLDGATAAFLRPEHERLFPVFLAPSTEDYRRQAIADRLVEIGEPAIPGLLDALGSDSAPGVPAVAAATLVKLGTAAVPGLLDALYDPFPEVRLAALAALRQLADPRAVRRVARTLQDADARVRAMAAGVLDAIGDPDTSGLVADALDDPDVDVRWRAAGALGAFGPPAVRPLLRALRDDSMRVRNVARDAIAVIGPDSVDTLVEAMADPTAAVRVSAAEALLAVGEVARPRVLRLCRHEDADLRWRAVHVLRGSHDLTTWLVSQSAQYGEPERPRPLDDGREADLSVLQAAVGGLNYSQADLAFPWTTHDDVDIRWTAAELCARAGLDRIADAVRVYAAPLAVAVTGSLIGAGRIPYVDLSGRQPHWRRMLAADLLAAGGADSVAHLIKVLGDHDPDERRFAAAAVAAIGDAAGPKVLGALRDKLARSGNRDAEKGLALALGELRWQPAAGALASLLRQTRDQQVALTAAMSLARLGDPGLSELTRALAVEERLTVDAARAGLVEAGAAAVPHLLPLAAGAGPPHAPAVEVLTEIATPRALFALAELGIRPR